MEMLLQTNPLPKRQTQLQLRSSSCFISCPVSDGLTPRICHMVGARRPLQPDTLPDSNSTAGCLQNLVEGEVCVNRSQVHLLKGRVKLKDLLESSGNNTAVPTPTLANCKIPGVTPCFQARHAKTLLSDFFPAMACG